MTDVVDTVLGPVQIGALGATLMHEHIFSFHSDLGADYPWEEEEEFIAGAIDKISRVKQAGIDSIVDLTVVGLGRDVRRVARIAEATGVNIIAATGIYASCCMPTYFQRQLPLQGPSFVEDFFVREIEEGIGRTGIRAAAIKCVTDREGVTHDVDIMLRSAARAQLRTDVPITTHTNAILETGLLQQRIFRQEGVDLSRVIIGHSGESTDLDYLQRLLDAGSYLGMDRFADYQMTSLERRLATIAELCARGYASRMVLSHDRNCGGDIMPEDSMETWYFGHIPTVVLPGLREHGVSESDIELMMTGNPAAIFGARRA
ncbi:MAG TPA: phosphotriesterase-related protein [Pseudolysinimonas sp.]|jgi:phosphotriesterase-related protein